MKIFFDHQTFSQQNYGGISRYICELIAGINQSNGAHQAHLSLLFSNNAYLKEKSLRALPFFPGQPFLKTQPYLYRFNKAFSRLEMQTRPYDVFHATYYEPYFMEHLRNRPFVVTLHDMIHEKYHSVYPELAADHHVMAWKQQILTRATAIIAISENTKRDLLAYYDLPPERIRVIYHGAPAFATQPKAEKTASKPYLLFVGNRGMYKNFLPFIRAVAPLLRTHSIRVICAGGGAFSPDEKTVLQQLGITQLVEQQPINDQRLHQLYQEALAFVFPSLYEGFGIPVLEAFTSGCPCLLSNRSSLPEVAGSAALYFDPDDPDSVRETVECILTDSAGRQQLIDLGYRQLQKFSWPKTVHETLALYESLG